MGRACDRFGLFERRNAEKSAFQAHVLPRCKAGLLRGFTGAIEVAAIESGVRPKCDESMLQPRVIRRTQQHTEFVRAARPSVVTGEYEILSQRRWTLPKSAVRCEPLVVSAS